MRSKKRYLLIRSMPEKLPAGAKLLFYSKSGYIVKADLKTALQMRQECILVSGSIRKLKHPKLLNRRKKHSVVGMK